MSRELSFRKWWRWHFLSVGGGSDDVLFGIKIYGNKHFYEPWFQYTVMKVYRVAAAIHRAKMWLFYRTTRRDCWTINTGLQPGYYDCDTLMLHGCMGLLCRYVEDECGGDAGLDEFTNSLRQPGSEGHGPREVVDAQADRQEEAITIYRWWKVQKAADEKRRKELLLKLYGNGRSRMKSKPVMDGKLHEITFDPFEGDEISLHKEFRALEAKIDEDEQAMLHRLIDIRQSLWT